MPPLPAAVAPLSPSSSQSSPVLIAVLALLLASGLQAQDEARFVADIELQTADELEGMLLRAEQLLVEGIAPQDDETSVTFVLHGPVIRALLRENYQDNKEMVDLAASLSALRVVSIKACRTWMGGHNVAEMDLQPFVQTVAYGPGEVRRLARDEAYLDF